jgi:hypothetical protein
MKIYKIFLAFILSIYLAGAVDAVKVGVIVEFPDGSVKTDCIFEKNSGYDILQESILDIDWSNPGLFGRALCKIDDIGDDVSSFAGNCVWDPNLFWAFYILDGSSWGIAPVSASSYTATDKDVIGFVRSGFDPITFAALAQPKIKTYEQVCDKLNVKDIKAYVDGKKESGADEDGGKIDAVPGSKLELKIKLENLYTDSEDIEINDIIVYGTLEDIDDSNDLQDESKEFNLHPEKEKEITLEFDIPLNTEDDDYDLILEIEGENELNLPYSILTNFEVEINKEKHDLIFDEITLDNNILCNSQIQLKIKLANIGKEKENIELTILNEELGINELENLNIDTESSFEKTYSLLIPKDKSGNFPITISATYNDGNDNKAITKEISVNCKSELSAKVTTKNNKEKITKATSFAVSRPQQITEPITDKKSFFEEFKLIILFAGFNLVIILSLISLIIKFLV